MNLELIFKRTIIIKTVALVLIVFWGAYVQSYNSNNITSNVITDVGGLSFLLFSILYFFTLYFLYMFNFIGKRLFVPLVGCFIILGFLTEFLNPNQFSKDILYFLIFYIISPIFFIGQGVIISLIYFTDIKNKFYK